MRNASRTAGSLLALVALGVLYPVGWALAHLPSRTGLWVGRRAGDLAWLLLPRRRAIALENLTRAFQQERSLQGLRRLARNSFQHLGMNLVEWCVLSFRPFPVLLSRVQVKGIEHVEAAAASGRGVLILTAHYGNWELMAAARALSDFAISVVVRPLDDPMLDWLVSRFRARSGTELISKRHALTDVLGALRRRHLVAVLLDQNTSRGQGVFAPFFGVPASTSKGLAVISLRTGAPVVPVFIQRQSSGGHVIEAHAVIPAPDDGDVTAYTAAFNRAIEAAVRREPGQWFWVHRRWRTQPPAQSGEELHLETPGTSGSRGGWSGAES